MTKIQDIKKQSVSTRDAYLNNFFQPEDLKEYLGLEIGPYDKPYLPRLEYPHVKYADVFTTDELVDRAIKNPKRNPDNVESVDYVIGEKSIADVAPKSSMSYVFCSHVFEHVPNFIQTLKDIESVLAPGGKILCAYPDRRYTFDINRNATTYEQLVDRYNRKLSRPDSDTVHDYFVNYRHVLVGRLWRNMDEAVSEAPYTEEYATLMGKMAENTYVDVHCNVFTDAEFASVIEQLNHDGYLNLKIIKTQKTIAPRNEFLTVIERES